MRDFWKANNLLRLHPALGPMSKSLHRGPRGINRGNKTSVHFEVLFPSTGKAMYQNNPSAYVCLW